jgi:hypothetical protein
MHSLNLMLPKEDRKAMLLRLYNEEVELMDSSKDRFKQKAKDADSPGEVKDEEDDADIKDEGDVEMKDEDVEIKDEDDAEDNQDGGVKLNRHPDPVDTVRAGTKGDVRGDVLENAEVIYPPS